MGDGERHQWLFVTEMTVEEAGDYPVSTALSINSTLTNARLYPFVGPAHRYDFLCKHQLAAATSSIRCIHSTGVVKVLILSTDWRMRARDITRASRGWS